uniref:Uncharacterized protein n=1 Tax=Babesia bovis TaxID=5865 RepID=S6C9B2_BABBO|nr:hypothetical protein [Babesia bovis]
MLVSKSHFLLLLCLFVLDFRLAGFGEHLDSVAVDSPRSLDEPPISASSSQCSCDLGVSEDFL